MRFGKAGADLDPIEVSSEKPQNKNRQQYQDGKLSVFFLISNFKFSNDPTVIPVCQNR